MNGKIKLLVTIVMISVLLVGCDDGVTTSGRIKALTDEQRDVKLARKWYDEVMDGFEMECIQETIREANADVEYRVVYDVSFLGYYYYSLQALLDGTGVFTYKVHRTEDFETGELVLDVTKDISREDTEKLLKAIQDNDFYNIPSIHPNEEMIPDGSTVFIEGYNYSELHFTRMAESPDTYPISKIHRAFSDYADTIAEEPVWVMP